MLPSKPIIVLVSGRAGVGKTTSCLFMEDIVNHANQYKNSIGPSKISHLAHGVKKTAYDSFGWDGIKDGRGRRLLQAVGQTGRDYSPDIWASQCLEFIKQHVLDIMDTTMVFVDDWRFPNELDFMKATGWNIFSIRIEAPNREILKGTDSYNDASESSLSDKPEDYDFFIDNTGSFDELNKQLIEILDKIKNSVDFFGGEDK